MYLKLIVLNNAAVGKYAAGKFMTTLSRVGNGLSRYVKFQEMKILAHHDQSHLNFGSEFLALYLRRSRPKDLWTIWILFYFRILRAGVVFLLQNFSRRPVRNYSSRTGTLGADPSDGTIFVSGFQIKLVTRVQYNWTSP